MSNVLGFVLLSINIFVCAGELVYPAIAKEWEKELRAMTVEDRNGYAGMRVRMVINHFNSFATERNDTDDDLDRIRKMLFANAVPVADPSLIMMGGGSGAGKTTIRAVLDAAGLLPKNRTEIDPDFIMAELTDYKKKQAAGDLCAAGEFHDQASDYAEILFNEAIAARYHVLYDGTMKTAFSSLKRIQRGVDANYSVVMAAVSCDTTEAVKRVYNRAVATNRWVPMSVIYSSHTGFSQSFMTYPPHMNRSLLYDNNNNGSALVLNTSANAAEAVQWDLFASFDHKELLTPQQLIDSLSPNITAAFTAFEAKCGGGFPAPTPQGMEDEEKLAYQLSLGGLGAVVVLLGSCWFCSRRKSRHSMIAKSGYHSSLLN